MINMETELLNDKSKVKGQIYIIKNTISDKCYVGQTLTHRRNRGKYRPFGFQGRFNDHVSEAVCNTKKKQCTYLNNAIRHYGKDVFEVSLITTCEVHELNDLEILYINQYNTLYPNGYNLTRGGKSKPHLPNGMARDEDLNTPGKRGGCTMRSEKTRKHISEQLRKVLGTEDNRKRQMSLTKEQHKNQKYEKFKNEKIDLDNLDQYIYTKQNNGNPFVIVKINGKQTSFVGKYLTLEDLRKEAYEFLEVISKLTATLPN
jgi:hypothetical protein